MLLGDMNDSLGMDEYEPEGGGDAIMNLVGPPADGLILLTKPLADQHRDSPSGCNSCQPGLHKDPRLLGRDWWGRLPQ